MPSPIAFELSNQFFITFLFTFAVTFGVVNLSGIFRGNKLVTAIISVALGLFASSYTPYVTILWIWLPKITIFFIAMFIIAFVMRIFGFKKGEKNISDVLSILGALLAVLISAGFYFFEKNPDFTIPIVGGGDNLFFAVGIIIIVLIFWFSRKAEPSEAEKLYEKLKRGGK